ncbi:unnamed protein product [Pseudo-nitzschia multistriata]|uniref:Cytochrome b5 heme-binding domain-containing protein n=1 Tax=Pseudo-nitzschia multistriata TaxID=183589 RepID=A0A448ZGG9_9STRA|nr:unnamed protein product [Pseudo-nitzschia multistriata]
MSVRLDTIQSLGRNLKDWCRHTLPLICLARYSSDRPIDWFFFWIGYKCCCRCWGLGKGFRTNRNSNASASANKNVLSVDGVELDSPTGKLKKKGQTLQERDTSDTFMHNSIESIQLTDLPSVVISNVACCLHVKDMTALDVAIRSGCSAAFIASDEQQESQTTTITQSRRDASVILHDVWKRLWYRDYGDVLLRWRISREALQRSLASLGTKVSRSCDRNQWLEEELSRFLDDNKSTKDFYFIFGECYMDYILAGNNKADGCYLGLHGHVFDFTTFADYHPGLVEPILKECGGDATFFFEDLPHSEGARRIAERLCVVVHHGSMDRSRDGEPSGGHRCGLELVKSGAEDASELERVLRSSNTRPPPLADQKGSGRSRNHRWKAHHVLPRRRMPMRHATLERIRTKFHEERSSQLELLRRQLQTQQNRFWKQVDKESLKTRIYYDPFLEEWIRWAP